MGKEQQYKANKSAKVGESIVCPVCGEVFTKKQYSQAFCCGECKDKFWNKKGDRHKSGYYQKYDQQHPERIERAAFFAVGGGRMNAETRRAINIPAPEGF